MGRRDEYEKARLRAAMSGGAPEDYLEDSKTQRSNKWSYGTGESIGADVVDEYVYLDERGENYLLVQKTTTKQYLQSHWYRNGWRSGKPKGPKLPYRLPQLLSAGPEQPIFICEGEKDAETAVDLGLVSTTASEGAGKWTKDLNRWFKGKHLVYIIADNDDPGRKHANKVAKNLESCVREVRIVELPGLLEHGDLSDCITVGGTKEELLRLCTAAPIFDDKSLVLDSSDPMSCARALLRDEFTDAVGLRTIHRHRGSFWLWENNRYRIFPEEEVYSTAWQFLEKALQQHKDGPKPFRPTKGRVSDTVSALTAITQLSSELEPPFWIKRRDAPPPQRLFACANGLLDLATRALHPASADFFNVASSNVSYAPEAAAPHQFIEFLEQLFVGDLEAKEALQDWFGYLLSPDTSQQKILLMVGPKRSGKGTIGRVLKKLLGEQSVAGPTMSSLSERFGSESFISRPVAIIADARIGSSTNKSAIVERLLSISGEDQMTIDRKFASAWHGKLPTRFVIFTNELPALNDGAGALASRFIILKLTISFFGKEDRGLADRLFDEMSGILNWAIDGYQRLQHRRRFFQPTSSQEALDEIELLGAPVLGFVRDYCELGPGYSVNADDLWTSYSHWAASQSMKAPSSKQWFGRNLRSAVAGLNSSKPVGADGARETLYIGIRLAPKAAEVIEQLNRNLNDRNPM